MTFAMLFAKLLRYLQNAVCQKRLCSQKSRGKMLMKLTPVVNFINIYGAAFAPIFFWQKITKANYK